MGGIHPDLPLEARDIRINWMDSSNRVMDNIQGGYLNQSAWCYYSRWWIISIVGRYPYPGRVGIWWRKDRCAGLCYIGARCSAIQWARETSLTKLSGCVLTQTKFVQGQVGQTSDISAIQLCIMLLPTIRSPSTPFLDMDILHICSG